MEPRRTARVHATTAIGQDVSRRATLTECNRRSVTCIGVRAGLCTFNMDKLITLHAQIAQFQCQNASLVSRLSRVLTGVC